MSHLWPKFSKESPCPACGHWDYTCRAGNKVFVCMRVDSGRLNVNKDGGSDGGWIHQYNGQRPIYVGQPRIAPRRINVESVSKTLNSTEIDTLAKQLGVSVESLKALDAAWSPKEQAWVFPMSNGAGEVVGFRTRYPDGEKRAITGSQGGLFIPDIEPEEIAFLPEGPTDTAALLTMGFYAIGRPSCNSGTEFLRQTLKRLSIRRVVVVADNDEEKERPNGTKWRPGLDGAKRLKKDLGLMSVLWMPPNPIKDSRQLLNKAGVEKAKKMINDSLIGKTWNRI